MTTAYGGRLYFTSTQANSPTDELQGEVLRRQVSYGFELSIWILGGVTGSFVTHEFDFSLQHISTHWDDDCNLVVGFETAINQIDVLANQGTTELRDCRVETATPYLETGPRMGYTYNDTDCTVPLGSQVYFESFPGPTVGAEWIAPGSALTAVSCPDAGEQALALQSGVDSSLTIATPDPHSHVHLRISIIAAGPWTGAATELLKLSVLGHGDIALSTLSTNGAVPQSLPNLPTGATSLPTDLNTCGLGPTDTAYNVVAFVDTQAIPHTGAALQLTLRTINAPAGAYILVDNVDVKTFTAQSAYCNQVPPPPTHTHTHAPQ
jgi:hypothetical protein